MIVFFMKIWVTKLMQIAEYSYCFPETLRRETGNQWKVVSKVCVLQGEMYRKVSALALMQSLLKLFSVPALQEEQRANN